MMKRRPVFKRIVLWGLNYMFGKPPVYGPPIALDDDKELPQWIKDDMLALKPRLIALGEALDAHNVAGAGIEGWQWYNPRFDDAE